MKGEMPVPLLELNSLPLRTRTFSMRSPLDLSSSPYFDYTQLPQYKDFHTLGRFIRKCMQRQAGTENANDEGFLPPDLLKHILTREVVQHALNKEARRLDSTKITNIVFNEISGESEEMLQYESQEKTYLVVLALLSLSDKIDEIKQFMGKDGICDQDLPLQLYSGDDGSFELQLGRDKQQRLPCFNGWRDNDRKFFSDAQWRLRVPTFGFDSDRTIQHQDLEPNDILPWQRVEMAESHIPISGGFGRVSKVKIHPLCHQYHETLKAINVSGGLFAMKTLKHIDDAKFKNEVKMLKKFNGRLHDHLVTLLGTFTQNNEFSMIFPWAECDVEDYWENKNPNPDSKDIHFVRWISSQCKGIMGALDVIHNPSRSVADNVSGRHGDIKPENILWFPSPTKKHNGIWVISDLGLSAFNREQSRSMVPNQSITWTPSYRPPECDLDGGVISRAFDIWTLGCFYLEMLCWLLGGAELRKDFREDRTTIYIHGTKIDIYFDIQLDRSDKTKETYVVLVKEAVAQMINTLHRHPRCTDYIHEFLDTIEKDMLLVLSTKQQRKRSPYLLEKLKYMDNKCENEAYCLTPTPDERPFQPPTRIEAKLSPEARGMVATHNMRDRLSVHVPEQNEPIHRSLRRDELENVDRLSLPSKKSENVDHVDQLALP